MAIIFCPECRHQISEFARFCPSCGYQKKNSVADKNKSGGDFYVLIGCVGAILVAIGVFGLYPALIGGGITTLFAGLLLYEIRKLR